MTVGAWAQLALAVAQLLLWITNKIDTKDWQDQGFKDAYLKFLEVVNKRVADMTQIAAENKTKTDEELDEILA